MHALFYKEPHSPGVRLIEYRPSSLEVDIQPTGLVGYVDELIVRCNPSCEVYDVATINQTQIYKVSYSVSFVLWAFHSLGHSFHNTNNISRYMFHVFDTDTHIHH